MDSVALGCPRDSLEGFSQVRTHLTDGAQRSLGDLSGDVSSWEGEAGLPDSCGVSSSMMLLCHNVSWGGHGCDRDFSRSSFTSKLQEASVPSGTARTLSVEQSCGILTHTGNLGDAAAQDQIINI